MFFGSGNKSSNRFDLSGENAPIFDGDSVYMTTPDSIAIVWLMEV